MYPRPGDIGICNYGPSHPCQADNNNHTVYVDYLNNPGMGAAVEWSMNASWSNAIGVTYHGTPVTSGDFETDVIYIYHPVDDGAPGLTWCDDPVDGTAKCDQWYVYFYKEVICPAGGGYGCGNLGYQRHIACHETGHSLGLIHPDQAVPVASSTNTHFQCLVRHSSLELELAGTHNGDLVRATYP